MAILLHGQELPRFGFILYSGRKVRLRLDDAGFLNDSIPDADLRDVPDTSGPYLMCIQKSFENREAGPTSHWDVGWSAEEDVIHT
jgi:hypothetical protein